MNKKNIKGLTLIEILIGVAITALMMGAMFASYSVVNNSYNQVTDKAKVSRSSRDIVGMIIKDIRLAFPHLSPNPFIVPCTCLTPA